MQPTICSEGVRILYWDAALLPFRYAVALRGWRVDEWQEAERCDLMDEVQVMKITLGQISLLVYVNRVNFICE